MEKPASLVSQQRTERRVASVHIRRRRRALGRRQAGRWTDARFCTAVLFMSSGARFVLSPCSDLARARVARPAGDRHAPLVAARARDLWLPRCR
ncbi:hypothetical protein GUJ93_ZPchr0006g46032 [Zizania palustris]|uniref:Uncharacterized protein n=1 Tax=Zizania palustris TaxID=103762 RepID=A0A8J5VX09_ZIZPA|nr:hypothetical protein GUJ93_ZPchr0006g46032 [Zizania palustris]